jgi:hypothetical protein
MAIKLCNTSGTALHHSDCVNGFIVGFKRKRKKEVGAVLDPTFRNLSDKEWVSGWSHQNWKISLHPPSIPFRNVEFVSVMLR